MADIMIDLETMGTDPYSPVVAIGAVRFDANDTTTLACLGAEHLFYQVIDLESSMEAGLKPSASTIKWWLTNDSVTPKARKIFAPECALSLTAALDAFTDWYNSSGDTLWGNSARFDLGLLADCYRALGKPMPWLHYHEGCYRTLKNLPAVQHLKLDRIGIHHNALDDALSQAMHLCNIVQHLGAYTLVPQPTPTEEISQ